MTSRTFHELTGSFVSLASSTTRGEAALAVLTPAPGSQLPTGGNWILRHWEYSDYKVCEVEWEVQTSPTSVLSGSTIQLVRIDGRSHQRGPVSHECTRLAGGWTWTSKVSSPAYVKKYEIELSFEFQTETGRGEDAGSKQALWNQGATT